MTFTKILSVVAFIFGVNVAIAGTATSKANTELKSILPSYLKIQEALAADTQDGVKEAALEIKKQAAKLKDKKLSQKLQTASTNLAQASDLKAARNSFKDLSGPIVDWTKKAKPSDVEVVHCSMAEASWVQKKGDVHNPYYGKSMLECGEKAS